MNSSAKLAVTLFIGTAVGAVAMHQLHAQAKPPAYVIVQLGEVRDRSVQEELGSKMAAVTLAHGGKYLARGRNVTPLEGKPAPQSVVIIAFENVEKAVAYRNSEAYRELTPLREKFAGDHSWIVEGLAN
jgi:uncharacterized protein (DUF1330 family)